MEIRLQTYNSLLRKNSSRAKCSVAVLSCTFYRKYKKTGFDITGYQFPDIRKLNIDHDANWLAVTFSYQDEKLSFKKADNCLLTYELKEII